MYMYLIINIVCVQVFLDGVHVGGGGGGGGGGSACSL